MTDKVAVLGAGSWGSALALLLARNDIDVALWGHQDQHMQNLIAMRENAKHLPGHGFPEHLTLYQDLTEALRDVRDVLIVVPSHAFVPLLKTIKPLLPANPRIIWGTKGVDPNSSALLSQEVAEVFGDIAMGVLSGPSFAKEVAEALPTAATISSNNADLLDDCLRWFHSDSFRIYISYDMIGTQICGVVKNVLAIASGLCDGMRLGHNTRAALITRGLEEMRRLVMAMGGDITTVYGLCGLGDLVLTATGDLSRNRQFGLLLGKGKTRDQIREQIGQAIEGLENADQVFALAQKYAVEMPICEQVYRIIHGEIEPRTALIELMQREPKSY